MKVKVTREDVELDSPAEALFYGLMHLHGIVVSCIPAGMAIEVGGICYWPGFCIAVPGAPGCLWVEVSDGQAEHMFRPARARWREEGHRLAVLYPEELRDLVTRANGRQVLEQLRIWAK